MNAIIRCDLFLTDDSESNLKLYIDKHGGIATVAGHNLQDK